MNPVPLDSVQPEYRLPVLSTIEDSAEDNPVPGNQLPAIGALGWSEIVLGCATFSNFYNNDATLASDVGYRTIRLAFRYGIRALDTSPYYGMSEIIVGACLRALASDFPRSTYKISTKVGRYGSERKDFDYSPTLIRKSVMRSLQRLNTTYLDMVYLHDVEYVASPMYPIPYSGDFAKAMDEKEGRSDWGLIPDKGDKVWGSGDERILAAVAELFRMKDEGLIRGVGISGYPLPTLLRLSRLIASRDPFRALDAILSYSHYTLQNTRFERYLPHLIGVGRVQQVFTASPLSMGLLTSSPPSWHPGPVDLLQTSKVAGASSETWRVSSTPPSNPASSGLPDVALGFALRRPKGRGENSLMNDVPTIIGASSLREVHACMKVWREVSAGPRDMAREGREDQVMGIFKAGGWLNWSWGSPPSKAFDAQAVDMLGRRLRLE